MDIGTFLPNPSPTGRKIQHRASSGTMDTLQVYGTIYVNPF